jgi:hypothetical protein
MKAWKIRLNKEKLVPSFCRKEEMKMSGRYEKN